jgi:beta-glucoside operon transcriptional antiterminator
MEAMRRLNNNVVLCIDDNGSELIAMGRGLGFGKMPREVSLREIERTFYNIDKRYLAVVSELSPEIMEFAANIISIARRKLSHELSPNSLLILSDHIAYVIERAKNHVYLQMPLMFDIEQNYPKEMQLGKYITNRIEKEFNILLPKEEAAGLALSLVSAEISSNSNDKCCIENLDNEMFKEVTAIIEEQFNILIDRESFAFSRYATHMMCLFKRLHMGNRTGNVLSNPEADILQEVNLKFPKGALCADTISHHIYEKWGYKLSGDEKSYLILHIARIYSKGKKPPT